MSINLAENSKVTVDAAQDIALLPGAELNIAQGAELVLGSNAYIYDQEQWDQSYLWAVGGWTHPVIYSPTRPSNVNRAISDAKINVNGTLTVNGQLYTTKDGAAIVSDGGGKVVLNAAPTATGTTYQYDQTNEKYISIPVTAAQLMNSDSRKDKAAYGVYTQTADAAAGTTFCYCVDACGGVWHRLPEQSVAKVSGSDVHYFTLSDAVNAANGVTVQMLNDTSEAGFEVSKDVYLDLNGKTVTLSSDLTVSGSDSTGKAYKLYGIDSTHAYTIGADHSVTYPDANALNAGKIVGTVNGVAKVYEKERYVAVQNDNETSFHQFNISVTGFRVLFNPTDNGSGALFFVAQFRGDDAVLGAVDSVYFKLDGTADTSCTPIQNSEVFTSDAAWNGTLDATTVSKEHSAQACIQFSDGTVVASEVRTVSYIDALKTACADANYGTMLSLATDKTNHDGAKEIVEKYMAEHGNLGWGDAKNLTAA